jgi:hypothetical protein
MSFVFKGRLPSLGIEAGTKVRLPSSGIEAGMKVGQAVWRGGEVAERRRSHRRAVGGVGGGLAKCAMA